MTATYPGVSHSFAHTYGDTPPTTDHAAWLFQPRLSPHNPALQPQTKPVPTCLGAVI